MERDARPEAPDLSQIVLAARGGDLGAFGDLVRRFQDMAYGAAYAYVGDHHRAQDATQEAFLEAFANLPKLREPAAFPGWFRQILVRRCGRQLHDAANGRAASDSLRISLAGERWAPEANPMYMAEQRELQATVRAAIAALPERERVAVSLYYLGDYSQREVAEFLDVPVTTVKKRLFAARQRLKERLKEGMMSMVGDTLGQQRPSREERFAASVQAIAAVKQGDTGALGALLDLDPTLVNVRDPASDGQPLLFVAAMYGCSGRTKRYQGLVDLLVARGATRDIFAAAYLDDPARARELLAADPSLVHARDTAGMSALHHAAERGATEVARLLIEAGADVNARDGRGEAPIDHAGHAGPWKPAPARQVVQVLLDHGATVDVFQASALGDVPRLSALLDEDPQRANARTEKNRTPLYEAAHNLHLAAVELLLDRGADVETRTDWGEAPISTAIAHSWDTGGPEVVARLRAAGATLCLRDALCLGDLASVQALLAESPARLRERSWGETPLHIAARWGHQDVAAYLLDLGHEVNPEDDQGNTPAALAAHFGKQHLAAWLVDRGGRR